MYQDLNLVISKYSLAEFKERLNDGIQHTLISLLTMQEDYTRMMKDAIQFLTQMCNHHQLALDGP